MTAPVDTSHAYRARLAAAVAEDCERAGDTDEAAWWRAAQKRHELAAVGEVEAKGAER